MYPFTHMSRAALYLVESNCIQLTPILGPYLTVKRLTQIETPRAPRGSTDKPFSNSNQPAQATNGGRDAPTKGDSPGLSSELCGSAEDTKLTGRKRSMTNPFKRWWDDRQRDSKTSAHKTK